MPVIATDPLSLVFIGCFLFGLLFLLITALLGGLTGDHGIGHVHVDGGHIGGHDLVHAHSTHVAHVGDAASHHTASHGGGAGGEQQGTFSIFAIVNPTSVILFLLGFGFFGYVFHNVRSLALPFVLLLAALGGVVIAGLILLLISRIFGSGQATTIQDVSDRTGLLGKVSLTIPANGLGEILYLSPGGMRKSIPARSVDGRRLERDQEVVVVNYEKGVAEVDTWEHFVNQEEAGQVQGIEAPSADELAALRSLLEEESKKD
ncbi:MAG: hypothetical protein IMW89_04220 [Ktedonobacteraceae bacterium]|nr:hypothetical protein [Ktedonobacteraceae bacterium]